MEISEKAWDWYINRLRKVNNDASYRVLMYLRGSGFPQTKTEMDALIDYCHRVNRKYGEAAAEIACQMYDQIAALSKAAVPSAVPASVADIHEVAKAVVGTAKTGNEEIVSAAVGRLVKRTGVDTTMQNALRDGAEWAWVPHGDTCAFCIALASRGWQRASTKAIKNGHAEHIHANCDCTYAVRFDSSTDVEGYNDGKQYLEMYKYTTDENGNRVKRTGKSDDKINQMRREFYAENKASGLIDLNSSVAEELIPKNRNGKVISFEGKIASEEKFSSARQMITDLSDTYRTRLERVTVGAEKAAGDVDISGSRMRLNTGQAATVLHEFAHTLASDYADKVGVTNDKDFWKEIRGVYRAYHKDVDRSQDVWRWISNYEHSSRNIDEFMAEAFTQAKLSELGYKIPSKYGTDLTYSRQVLDIVDKYFKRL